MSRYETTECRLVLLLCTTVRHRPSRRNGETFSTSSCLAIAIIRSRVSLTSGRLTAVYRRHSKTKEIAGLRNARESAQSGHHRCGVEPGLFWSRVRGGLAIDSVSLFADSVDFLEDASVNFLIAIALGWSATSRARVGMGLAGVCDGLYALRMARSARWAWHRGDERRCRAGSVERSA